ncbi:MAG: low molecular weight phosphotyrosine protein phosphatase [Eggerthellaceae bacterium]
MHPGTRRMLEEAGISCEGKTARRLRSSDAEAWDLFVGMDEANMRDMRRQLGRAADGRLHKLLEFAGSDRDVADPWYTGDFEATYDDVLAGCAGLLAWLDAGASRR